MTFETDWVISPKYTIEEILEYKNLSKLDFLNKINLDESIYEKLVTGNIFITEDISKKFSIELGSTKQFWTNLFSNYYNGLKQGKKEL